jgi:hypothetical protein
MACFSAGGITPLGNLCQLIPGFRAPRQKRGFFISMEGRNGAVSRDFGPEIASSVTPALAAHTRGVPFKSNVYNSYEIPPYIIRLAIMFGRASHK